jgi:recombinational DNA repair ATPase RecF
VETSPEEIGLYEDIEYVITNKPDLRNICEYSHVKKRLSECVKERNTEIKENYSDGVKTSVDEAYEALSSKYGEELNDDEIRLVESVSGNDKAAERVFNETRENLISKIKKELSESEGSEKQRWSSLLENVKSKTYNKKTALVDIAEMLEAGDVFNH